MLELSDVSVSIKRTNILQNVALHVPNGKPQRWRCLNVANTTFCRLDLTDPVEGLDTALWELGSDGGFEEVPFKRGTITSTLTGHDHSGGARLGHMGQGILLFPGERLDVLFTPIGTDGQSFTVFQNDWMRGRHSAFLAPGGSIFLGDDLMDGAYPRQKYMELIVDGPNPGTGPMQPPARLVRTSAKADRSISTSASASSCGGASTR